jgi:hypothetical protein
MAYESAPGAVAAQDAHEWLPGSAYDMIFGVARKAIHK